MSDLGNLVCDEDSDEDLAVSYYASQAVLPLPCGHRHFLTRNFVGSDIVTILRQHPLAKA
jgi:hypothetical protein